MNLIFITGPSGSGKTTISKYISNNLINSYVLSTDNYYRTGFFSKIFSKIIISYFDKILSHKQKLIKHDINSILKYKSIDHYYKYDFVNKLTKKNLKNVSNIQNLIVEGIFSLELTDFFLENQYLLIRLKEKKNICRKRICERDILERGKNKILNFKEFNNGWKIYHDKEKRYRSKINRGITLKNKVNLELLLTKLSG
tara:strand:- start:1793 stop:2386 length:594 start_codon:yes stop_codon:yes gene_type:complete